MWIFPQKKFWKAVGTVSEYLKSFHLAHSYDTLSRKLKTFYLAYGSNLRCV